MKFCISKDAILAGLEMLASCSVRPTVPTQELEVATPACTAAPTPTRTSVRRTGHGPRSAPAPADDDDREENVRRVNRLVSRLADLKTSPAISAEKEVRL